MVAVVAVRLRAERILREGERLVNYHKLAATDMDKLLPWLKDNVRGHDQVIEAIFLQPEEERAVGPARPDLGKFPAGGADGDGQDVPLAACRFRFVPRFGIGAADDEPVQAAGRRVHADRAAARHARL